ncbi:hypothetical protein HBI25_111280 [Parastagonospora nodorum]|nr:hypothetical protein HBH52_094030 [Parastagonospora nodorum]KAH4049621.1 hypothetical protein HBH49_135290 [Parastagonospora nodorum]KAH4201264.1 hypothetical protein HBH42_027200 [Parastagonospora nodorum]KAH4816158.1 hypothetical protein HBH61_060140 [Parastagonospora nodorum]KAH4940337.1 hypothetical protein HBI79_042010 [Parastagonospora nodorum]
MTYSAPPAQPVDEETSLLEIFQSHMDELEPVADGVRPGSFSNIGSMYTPPATAVSNPSTGTISLTSETAFLLQTYVRTVATWMDLFDFQSSYQLRVPRLVLNSPLLFHGVCAFTANHLALSNASNNPAWRVVAVKHYGEALRLLIEALSMPDHEHALTASMLLLSYEIHKAQRSEDYRRHFLGLSTLIRSRGITAQSPGTDRANFWIYVRHEIALAFSSGTTLVLDPAEWAVTWMEGETREDVLGNHVVWILARVVNLIHGPHGRSTASKSKREAFLEELEVWRAGLSDTFVGIPYGEQDEEGFRKVYFPVVAAAAAAFWYHIVHILLYAEPTLQDDSYIPLIQEQAMQITNIAISDFPAALKVFSTHGLFYAAKHIQGISRKARIWNVLKVVEAETGYNTRATVKHLQDLVEQDR